MIDDRENLIAKNSHGGIANNVKVNLDWIDSEIFEREDAVKHLEHVHGILVPGGFGERGAEGKIQAAKFARERDVPYFGICFGMQMACIEAARNVAGVAGANSSEFGPTKAPIVGLMTEWVKGNEVQRRTEGTDLGGTMRLGAYQCILKAGTKVAAIYGQPSISERHRHRYEVNINYKPQLEKAGMVFSGMSPDGASSSSAVTAPWAAPVKSPTKSAPTRRPCSPGTTAFRSTSRFHSRPSTGSSGAAVTSPLKNGTRAKCWARGVARRKVAAPTCGWPIPPAVPSIPAST